VGEPRAAATGAERGWAMSAFPERRGPRELWHHLANRLDEAWGRWRGRLSRAPLILVRSRRTRAVNVLLLAAADRLAGMEGQESLALTPELARELWDEKMREFPRTWIESTYARAFRHLAGGTMRICTGQARGRFRVVGEAKAGKIVFSKQPAEPLESRIERLRQLGIEYTPRGSLEESP
jgi:hypothetical protein